MRNIETMGLEDFLQPFTCACGREHRTALRRVAVETGALRQLPDVLRSLGAKHPFIIADATTHAVAGQRVACILAEAGLHTACFVYQEAEVVPDEHALGAALMAYDPAYDMIVGVGSGTINDISRFVSHRVGRPYCIVGTAPSMDGFASTVAPMITNHMKVTYAAHTPSAIVADLDILAEAPQHMIAAGFGDILGKYTCLCDWQLSSIIQGEYHCQTVADIVRLALERTIACRIGLQTREPEAIRALTEALILSGIAMSYVGNSRPASGCEHHLAHFWEMRFLSEGRKAVLHGAKVGIGEMVTLKLYEYLRAEEIDWDAVYAKPTPRMDEAWEQAMREAFREAAPEVIALEHTAQKNAPEARARRLTATRAHWPRILEAMARLPLAVEAETLLRAVGGPTRPAQEGIGTALLIECICCAKEVRDRYTVLQLLWDLGLLEAYASRAAQELAEA